jgi:hypothetical protein
MNHLFLVKWFWWPFWAFVAALCCRILWSTRSTRSSTCPTVLFISNMAYEKVIHFI